MKMITFCLCQVFFAGKSGYDLQCRTSRHQVIVNQDGSRFGMDVDVVRLSTTGEMRSFSR